MQSVDLGVAGTVAMIFIATAVMLGIVWFLLPTRTPVCAACGARQPPGAPSCAACGSALPGPPLAHPGGAPYGFPPASPPDAREPRVEEGIAYNHGMTRRVVTAATVAMGLGIGVRLLGMLGVFGLPQIPTSIEAALTVAGGLVAFVGFVFLDAA